MARLTSDWHMVIGKGKYSKSKKHTHPFTAKDKKAFVKLLISHTGCRHKLAEDVVEEWSANPKIKGGDLWSWFRQAGKDINKWGNKAGKDIKKWGDQAGKDIKKGVDVAGKWAKKAAIDAVGSIPILGAYGREGLMALDEHRAYDAKKASKEAVKSIPLVGEVVRQGWDDLEKGRKFDLGKAIKNQAISTAVSAVPGGVGKAVAGKIGDIVREKTGGSIHRVIRHHNGDRTVIGPKGRYRIKRGVVGGLLGGARTRATRGRTLALDIDDEPLIDPLPERAPTPAPAPAPKKRRQKKPVKRCGNMYERGAIVRDVMDEFGLSLGDASRYVKENGLY